MGNEKIIIVTNISQLSDVNSSATFDGFENLKNNGFMIFTDGKLVTASDLKDADIVFVWDRNTGRITNTPEWWADIFLSLKNNDKWYVVYHSKGLNSQYIQSSATMVCRQGEHKAGNFVYREIVKILLDNEKNKKERIIKSVFSLEPVLEFLHGCLVKQPEKEDYEKLQEAGIDPDKLKNKITVERSDSSYDNALTALRKELLNEE